MKTLSWYLNEYSISHQNPKNIKIHSVCVPAIMWSLLGLLSLIEITPDWNLGHVVALGVLIRYSFFKNAKLVVAMTVVVAGLFLTYDLVPNLPVTAATVFVLAWVGQFYGHKIEGKKPSFFQDVQFLLIGPLWVLKKVAPGLIGLSK